MVVAVGCHMSTAGLELPYPRVSKAKFQGGGGELLGGESNITFVKC